MNRELTFSQDLPNQLAYVGHMVCYSDARFTLTYADTHSLPHECAVTRIWFCQTDVMLIIMSPVDVALFTIVWGSVCILASPFSPDDQSRTQRDTDSEADLVRGVMCIPPPVFVN